MFSFNETNNKVKLKPAVIHKRDISCFFICPTVDIPGCGYAMYFQDIQTLRSLFKRRDKFILGDPGAVSRAGKKDATKVFKHRRKSRRVPTLSGPFPNGQVNAGSWLGTKNALYYCAQSGNSISWVLFVSSYTTAFDSITPCLAHAPNRCTQSGNFQFDINILFQNTVCLYTRLLSKTYELLSFTYNQKFVCEGLSKISGNFTLHLIKVGKLKRFKKVSSDLKTILKSLRLLAVSWALRKAKHVNQS